MTKIQLFLQIRNYAVHILDRHTDLISSCGILAITTCLLAAKIFQGMPSFLPRLSRIVFNYGGIIWLNVQMRELIKSSKDWMRAFQLSCWGDLFELALRVAIKAFNILLTCVNFTCSVVTGVGYPSISLAVQMALRPIALSFLALSILTDSRDYVINKTLLEEFERIECRPDHAYEIPETVVAILEVFKSAKSQSTPQKQLFADRVVRQLTHTTIQTFQESLSACPVSSEELHRDALKLFFLIKDSLVGKQAWTKSNLSLTAMGYLSMGICRAFPETVADWLTRWGNSVLFTDELIRRKLFESDLAHILHHP